MLNWVKVVLKRNCITVTTYTKKKSQFINQSLHLQQVKKEEQTKPKVKI